jgi:hypothetical protein
MSDIEPSYDYTERQRAREKAIHWENRACEAEAKVKRLREDRERLAYFIENIDGRGYEVMRGEDGSWFVVT